MKSVLSALVVLLAVAVTPVQASYGVCVSEAEQFVNMDNFISRRGPKRRTRRR